MAKEKLKGLGGWLIFFIITLFVSILMLILSLVIVNIMPEFDSQKIIFFLLYGLLLVFAIILLFSIFRKKKYAPKLAISFYAINIIVQTVIAFLIRDLSIERLTVPLIGIIWIAYFLKSKRVKNTFVN